MMRRASVLWAVLVGLAPAAALSQTHVVKRPETVVRAVAVYEWTGEEGKATASRVVPVSIFINGQLEDAGIYMARPVPFALDTGTIFELQKAGVPRGTLDLAYSRHYSSNGMAAGGSQGPSLIDDGWLGYGPFKPRSAETVAAAKKSGPLPQVVTSGGNRPHFSNTGSGGGKADSASADTNADAAHKPVDRSTAAGGGTTVSAEEDPDQPTMRKRDNGDSDSAKDDPERPTLKKRSPADAKAAQKKKDQASVTGSGTLNDDPDRPVLHRGAPAGRTDEDSLPPLHGLPKDMHQMVAVSDARDRPEHDFKRGWESDAERAEVTAKMEELARARLAQYDAAAAPASAASPASAVAKGSSPGANKLSRKAPPAPARLQAALADEVLDGYTLSYGGAATYFFSASSLGTGGVVRYVSLVAQREPTGELKVALSSATDSRHLDRAPYMRLVDVIDADASNRASMLFELRAQNSRQFALYRIIGAAAEQTFVTATPE